MMASEKATSLRAAGWAVAVHNDYRLGGESFTFWLFTKGNHFVKGEGSTDADALAQCAASAAALDAAAAVDGDAQWNAAIEAAKKIAKESSFPFPIEVWINSTKKEITALVGNAIAVAIGALKRG
jgi:hypothetical protein